MSSSTPKTPAGGAKRLQSAKGATLLATAVSSSSSASSTSSTSSSSLAGLLEAFPVWVEQQGPAEKEDKNAGQYLLSVALPAQLRAHAHNPCLLAGACVQESMRTRWACPCQQQQGRFAMPGSGRRSCCRACLPCPWCAFGLLHQARHQPQQTARKVR
jgi:hypothetical protein